MKSKPGPLRLYDGLEEAAFKQVSNGYVFTSSCPWLIGPRRGYLVNERW